MEKEEKDDIDAKLRQYEAIIDTNDPEQVKLLEQMREHTRRLHQVRGDWNKPSTFRNWNDPTPRSTTTAPLAIESFREYKAMRAKETKPLEVLALEGADSASTQPTLLKAGEAKK